jgi:hypothetical protein
MTDAWYYAEGGRQRGPLSLAELLPLIARIADPQRVMVWRDGFDDWKPVEEVHEFAEQLSQPSPLKATPPPIPEIHERGVKPELSGIGGWLALLALTQISDVLGMIVAVGQIVLSSRQFTTADEITAFWGELVMNAALMCLCIYTAALLFKHSRRFSTFFIIQTIIQVLLPIMDLLWAATIYSISRNIPISAFLIRLGPYEVGLAIGYASMAAISIPYVLRSQRVANTFTK